jgi:hypothetical protein
MGAEWRPTQNASAHSFNDFLTGEYFLVDFEELTNPTMFPIALKWVLPKLIDVENGKGKRRRFGNRGVMRLHNRKILSLFSVT